MRAAERGRTASSSRVIEGAQSTLVLVSRPMDSFDAVATFSAISANGEGFILEGRSIEPGADRFVYVGAGDCARLITGPDTARGSVDPADALRGELQSRRIQADHAEELPPFLSGAVGFFGYEAVRHFEPSVARIPNDPNGLPEAAFFLPNRHIAYDRGLRTAHACVLVEGGPDERVLDDARVKAEALVESAIPLEDEPTASRPISPGDRARFENDPEAKARYCEMVNRAKAEIERGELIQVVVSQSATVRTSAAAVSIYEQLAAANPSPYMFMLNFGEYAVVGSSPELLVRSRRDRVSMHPIAGTRPRGHTPEQDAALEADLLTNEKERAEHVMLVDLARNDLGRVAKAGSVDVTSFMSTERYSHVMHLVSRVGGQLRADCDGLDAFVAGFPLGTLTGAPKLRSIELIAELESTGRGPYCGGVGWFDAGGDVDTGTVIRCVTLSDGTARVQAGGGIVFDSDPDQEFLESVQKMRAQLEAISAAEAGTDAAVLTSGSPATESAVTSQASARAR